VIAREVKANSSQIDALTGEIVSAAATLMAEAEQVEAGNDRPAGPSGSLTGAVDALRDAATRTAAGMRLVDVNAAGLIGGINAAVEGLEHSLGIVAQLEAVAADLQLEAGDGAAPSGLGAEDPAWGVMEQLKAAYTMASERAIHNRFLLPGMALCAVQERAAPAAISDDDLFDDALF